MCGFGDGASSSSQISAVWEERKAEEEAAGGCGDRRAEHRTKGGTARLSGADGNFIESER